MEFQYEAQSLFILKEKNCQTIPPGTLNMFYILVIHTDNAQMSFLLIALCQPGGAAINFSKSPEIKIKQHFYFKKPCCYT